MADNLIVDSAGRVIATGGGSNIELEPRLPRRRGSLLIPSTFDFDFATHFPYSIWQDSRGRFITTFDPRVFIPSPDSFDGTVLWLDAVNGNDANAGTFDSPKKTFKTASTGAIAVANTAAADTLVICKAGTYDINNSWNGGTRFTVPNLWVIGYGGRVVLSLHQNPSWSGDATYTSCSSTTTFTTFARIVDLINLDAFGDYLEFVEVATPTLCNTLAFVPGTAGFCCQDGSKVYARRADGVTVSTSNTRVYRHSIEGARMATGAGGRTVVANIDFEGGNSAAFIADGNGTGSAVLINCSFKWAGRATWTEPTVPVDGFKAKDVKTAILYRCVASRNSKDGFNFTEAASVEPAGITIECWAHHNGVSPSTSNNGLTYHDGCKGIDIGGVYDGNNGGNVTIINAGTQLMCMGTYAGFSQGDASFGGSDSGINYYALDDAELYLSNCEGFGSPIEMSAISNADIYYRDHRFGEGSVVRGAASKIEPF